MEKTLIKNAKIYDGSGEPAFFGDVLIEGERIVQLDASISVEGECKIVDLAGLSLAPGFIDAHSHNDWFTLREEPLKYFAPFIEQGITTFVSGNCGLAATGFADDTPHKDKIGGGLFSFKGCRELKGQVKDFLEEMKQVATESYRVLKKDKFCAILMGDTRKNGHMVPMSFEVMRIFEDAGFKLKELIIKEQHNCKATGYWKTNSIKYNFLLIAHEYLFVFRKP